MRRPPVSAVGVLAVATVLFVVAVVVVVVLTVRGADDGPSGSPSDADGPSGGNGSDTPAVTTLAALADAEPAVGRGSFCAAVDDADVVAALDGASGSDVTAASYDNGDLLPPAAVPGTGASVEAVAHEYGCSWTASDGTVARAWVFAPPVAQARAKRLARSAERADGCTARPSEPFGDPTASWTCTDATGAVTAGHAGLFGDAWLSCTLSGPATDATDLPARSDRWCVAAAVAATQADG